MNFKCIVWFLKDTLYLFKIQNYHNLGLKISLSFSLQIIVLLSFIAAFQTVPSLDVTKKKFMTNFLGFSQTAGITKRQSGAVVDTVLILDGSGSVPRCDFSKAKEALRHMMTTLRNPQYDSKFAAVTFSSRATVSFQFLPYSSAANRITTIPYPGGMTNTQEALLEAKRLFDNPNSGTFLIITSATETYACYLYVQFLNSMTGREIVSRHLTIVTTRY